MLNEISQIENDPLDLPYNNIQIPDTDFEMIKYHKSVSKVCLQKPLKS